MSVATGVRRVWAALGWAPVLPGVVLHELAHAAAGRLFGATVGWSRLPDGRPVTQLAWPGTTPRWQIRVAHLAPTILTPVAAAVAIGALAVAGVGTSPTPYVAAWGLLLAGNVLAFAIPSDSDLHPEGL